MSREILSKAINNLLEIGQFFRGLNQKRISLGEPNDPDLLAYAEKYEQSANNLKSAFLSGCIEPVLLVKEKVPSSAGLPKADSTGT